MRDFMKKYINEFKVGETFYDVVLAIKNKRFGKTRDKKDYLDLQFADKTGEVGAKVWQDNLSMCENIEIGDIVSVNGVIEEYNNVIQIKIKSFSKVEDFDVADFVIQTDKNIEEMYESLLKIIKAIKNKPLKLFLENVFYDEEFSQKFKKSPGAERIHHACLGGLLVHVNEMCNLAKVFIKEYPDLNFDLLYAGILLHDIGKIRELGVKTFIYRTVEGSLLGHLMIGSMWVNDLLNKEKDFPKGLKNELLHLIVSHHGFLEFGSPILPKTQEAVCLHYLDNISSKVNLAYNVTAEYKSTSDVFSQFNRVLGTDLYISENFDDISNTPKPKNLTLGI